MLDVVFKEDESLVRKNNGAENLWMLRKIAMNILKKENPNHKKMSKNMKRFRSGLKKVLVKVNSHAITVCNDLMVLIHYENSDKII